jgi:sirohydrochlorin cobaltochelatase
MLILVAHGSRDPRWRKSIHDLGEAVQARLEGGEVGVAFMQFDGPSLTDVVREAAESGHRSLQLLPLFMASAGHVDKDIRPLVAELSSQHPDMELQILTPVGEDSHFPALILDIVSGPPATG